MLHQSPRLHHFVRLISFLDYFLFLLLGCCILLHCLILDDLNCQWLPFRATLFSCAVHPDATFVVNINWVRNTNSLTPTLHHSSTLIITCAILFSFVTVLHCLWCSAFCCFSVDLFVWCPLVTIPGPLELVCTCWALCVMAVDFYWVPWFIYLYNSFWVFSLFFMELCMCVFHWMEVMLCCCVFSSSLLEALVYWAIQAGLLTPLTFARHRFKSLGCLYFRCVLSSQWKAVTVNLRILRCQH